MVERGLGGVRAFALAAGLAIVAAACGAASDDASGSAAPPADDATGSTDGSTPVADDTVASPDDPSPDGPAPDETTPDDTAPDDTVAATSTEPTTTTTGVPAPTGIVLVPLAGADLRPEPGAPPTHRFAPGVVLPYDEVRGDDLHILSPCEVDGWVSRNETVPLGPATIVIDPGHGGADEPGAVGPTGLVEADVNLAVAERVVAELADRGIDAVLTRTADYRATLRFRARIADVVDASALVSIHHNAEADGHRASPGTETYQQVDDAESRRLSGLLYEELVPALGRFPADWAGDSDAGAKYRRNDEGGDYYGILRRPREAGVTAVLVEAAFITNPTEEALLRRDDVLDAEATAMADAIVRWLTSDDEGSGFVEPYPRGAPAGSGGGAGGCVDP
jgi:N-acetylmuramoyl-L-alanine amidase